jgi:hypothetical protein
LHIQAGREITANQLTHIVRPECGVVWSNSCLAGHFDRLLSVKERTGNKNYEKKGVIVIFIYLKRLVDVQRMYS